MSAKDERLNDLIACLKSEVAEAEDHAQVAIGRNKRIRTMLEEMEEIVDSDRWDR